ncbi:hypothetical protein HFX_0339 [Haloferax mediterranei ATCC 33500]|uniref:Uncharacterized protein n=1 Tax=Haloferax mediterranei (strain ATCC 33500 / DSM 1411 / JCM 8866 / NBRC 14739 / NCIMB 2177 / R-4) TaxID=523841 RepID=I3R1G6_HALMT|nr:hypothetical protein [Haloferax mediterranei]AFK18076.1 hypothetical protein HFX_0339 [Haloferax mediterranei ATCC 33500]
MELLKPPFSNPARRIQERLATPKDESEAVSSITTTVPRGRRGTELAGECVVSVEEESSETPKISVGMLLTDETTPRRPLTSLPGAG